MKLAGDQDQLALTYVQAVTDEGYPLSVNELVAYMASRGRRRLTGSLMGAFERLVQVASWVEAEPTHQRLANAGWLDIDGKLITITDLGRAVLRAMEKQALEESGSLEVVLNAEDPLAYAQVLTRIARHDNAMLVDPYFRLASFLHVVEETSVSRLLVGENNPDLKGFKIMLANVDSDRQFAIRVSDEIHDRFVIPPDGAIESLGTSLSGVGKKVTILVRTMPPAADEVRRLHEEIWARSDPLEPASAASSP